MRIERVTEEDAKELLDIYAPYVTETAISFETEVPDFLEFKERIRNISSKYPYIKAVGDNEEILGYAYAATFKERRAYDWSVETTIYVRRDFRKKGIGTMLYDALEKALATMGILNVNACIAYTDTDDIHLTNASMYFHEKRGYTLVGTFHKSGYKFHHWYDMIWMEKMLGEHKTNQPPVQFGKWTV